MGWKDGISLMGYSGRTTLASGVFALAAILILLAIGGFRTAAAVSGDSLSNSSACPYSAFEGCEGVVSEVRPIVQPMPETAQYPFGAQEAEVGGLQGPPALGSPWQASSAIGSPSCVLPRPCRESGGHIFSNIYSDEESGIISIWDPSTLEPGPQGSAEQTVDGRCFLGIPCWLSEDNIIGEEGTQGNVINSTSLLQNLRLAYW